MCDLLPSLRAAGSFCADPFEAVWTHQQEGYVIDQARCQRLALGLAFGADASQATNADALMDLVDVTHYDDRSCYCLIQNPQHNAMFHLFCWALDGESETIKFPAAYLIRDMLIEWESTL